MNLVDKLKPRLLFKAKAPTLKEYIGESVIIDGQKIKIKTIVGNRFKPTFYEINGEHLIGMLRFHAQMLGDTSITEQQFLDFENIILEAERLPGKRSAIEVK